MADAHDVSERHLRQAWEDMPALKDSARYAELLGKPTVRERLVACWRSIGGADRGTTPFRLRWPAMAVALGVVLLSGIWLLRPASPDYETRIAQVRSIRLADGSIVTLGAQSAMDVDFTKNARIVRLTGGEAFFSVAKDRSRPFFVLAGERQVRVVGTRFNVNYNGERMRVGVEEGIVDVMQPAASGRGTTPSPGKREAAADAMMEKVRLVAGQQIAVAGTAKLERPRPLDGGKPGGWRTGRLDYRDALLSDIIADARRYSSHDIRVLTPALMQERLTTSFHTSQIDQMLNGLPQILPVTISRAEDGSIELR